MPDLHARELVEILRDLWKEVRTFPPRKWAKFLFCLGLFFGWMFLLWFVYQVRGELAPELLLAWAAGSLLLGYIMFIGLLRIFRRYDVE